MWARDGLIEKQIAKNLGIALSTLSDYKKKYPDFSDAIKKGKEISDYEVENALFKKALGYNATIKKAFKVKEITYKDGKRLKETEHIEYAEEEVHIPADTAAQIYWLNNRKPDKWSNKPQYEADNTENINENIKSLAEIINTPQPDRKLEDFENE